MSSYLVLKLGYINKTHAHRHKVELKTLYVNFVWLLQNRFLLSISRKWKTIKVSAFHAALVCVIKWWRVRFAFCPNPSSFTRLKAREIIRIWRKTRVKLFPNFTSIPFDYLLISWVTNYVSNRGFLTCLSWIVSIDRELHSLKRLELKFGLSFQNFSTTYL